MRDVGCLRVFGADRGDAGVGGFAGLGKGIVAGVKVFAFFELVLEEVFLVGELAVETKEALFVGGEALREVLAGLDFEGEGRAYTLMSILFFWCGFMIAG